MPSVLTEPLAELYTADETGWLDAMAKLASERRGRELDYPHLAEYLADMAQRDRREVESRLAVLIAHRLKWEHQPAKRSRSWLVTIEQQRQELLRLLASGTLRNHAESVWPSAYADGVRLAVVETGLAADVFPVVPEFDLTSIEDEFDPDTSIFD